MRHNCTVAVIMTIKPLNVLDNCIIFCIFLVQKLNEQAAAMFESGEEAEVNTGLGIMNELVVPCIPLLLIHDTERDLLAVEDMRNRWCSYLGQEMECESLEEEEGEERGRREEGGRIGSLVHSTCQRSS